MKHKFNFFNLKVDFDTEFDIPVNEYKERVEKVQEILVKRNIDLAFAVGNPFLPGDVFYLSGYDPQTPEISAISIISPTKAYLCVGPEGYEYAKESLKYGELINLGELRSEEEEYPYSKFKDIKEILYDAANNKIEKVGKLTFDSVSSVLVQTLIKNNIKEKFDIVDTTDILYEMRFNKSINEIKLIKIAFMICNEATRRVIEAIKPGVREVELAAISDYIHKYMGCSSFCFDTIILSGRRINTIIGRASDKKIKKGELVTFFLNGRYKGYSAHMARTVIAGGAIKEQIEFLEHGYNAYKIAIENFKYGFPAKNLDKKATEYLKNVGLDKYKVFSFCHGAGIHESYEGKSSNKFAEWLIPKNILMMIDICLYKYPKFYGLSLEDGAIINSEGETEVLTDIPIKLW